MNLKKTLSLVCIFVMIVIPMLGLASTVRDVSYEETLASDLKELGLFSGVSETDFALMRKPTRAESIVMLIRLLGKDSEVTNGNWQHPFNDVPAWAEQHIGYAYENGLTSGESATEFGSGDATAAMYLTFVLRSLGYSDRNSEDFVWDNPFDLARRIGILTDKVDIENFLRADVVSISYAALDTYMKDSTVTLAQKLIDEGVFEKEKYDNYYNKYNNKILNSQEISKKCSPAVFFINTYAFNGEKAGTGSGFFISSGGLAVTNYHVVANSQVVEVKLENGDVFSDVKIIDFDKENDVVLLKVKGNNFPFLELGDSKLIKQGQEVYAIGSPLGLDNTMSQGIISNPNRILADGEYIQISVPIAPGSSGGALIDGYGKAIGITSAGFANSTGDLNLARPINIVRTLNILSSEDLILWNDYFYPDTSKIHDFGAFSGVKLLDTVRTPLGYVYKYDAFDFHNVGDLKESDCYGNTIYYYYDAILKQGFKHTEVVNDFCGKFESDDEVVYLEIDLFDTRAIYVITERVVQYYPEFKSLPDLGWYTNMKISDSSRIDKSMVYLYKWSECYNYNDFKNYLDLYFELLEEKGFICRHSDENIYLFEGKGWSVVYTIDDRNICVDIAKL